MAEKEQTSEPPPSIHMSSKKHRAEKEQSSPCVMTSLPEDVIIDILARVPRCNYPKLSLVSKHFRSLVASREIYARRSLLGCTEHCLYVVLSNAESGDHELYILRRKANGKQGLFLINSLPSKPRSGSYVAMGSKIYVFNNMTSLSIDCISHTAQPLPSMPVLMDVTYADSIDGRIYVIGYIRDLDSKKEVMVVFNTETQTWEPETIKIDMVACECVVMGGKMYFRDNENCVVYEPKGRKWETGEMLNAKEWENACVVDDVLYYYDDEKNKLRAYDSEKKCWGVVKGVEDFLTMGRESGWWKTASYGGKLFWFHDEDSYVGATIFAEISLERNQKRKIRGKVEWWHAVEVAMYVHVINSLAVIV
ncbi:unnamed protein product [Microthlaspi erraticum]|uniref:F-box domain-containing protein n=1 Tax=Microthlaspi erraticum TaxID=1685480 RepID=A0A6D2HK20_9BRAS|nr:unnamed protein product [Microthlaspi erraticum]